MASALVPLANITLSGSQSSVSFTSISGSYRDLMLVITATTGAATGTYVRLNNDSTAANYYMINASGDGTSPYSYTSTSWAGLGLVYAAGPTTSAGYHAMLHILDYAQTDKYKSAVSRSGYASQGVGLGAHRWLSTSAVTSLVVVTGDAQTFSAGTTMALYGVSA